MFPFAARHINRRMVVLPKRSAAFSGSFSLQTRADVRELILKLWKPILAISSPSKARCRPGVTGATYGEAAVGLEGFCRPLWGVLACAHADELPGTGLLPGAVAAGVDPTHAEFWGWFEDGDQRCVEMGVLAWGLATAPAAFWEKVDATTRGHLAHWLRQINRVKRLPANNWRFFRILVNIGLQSVQESYSADCLAADLAVIEDCYLGDGWYSDGQGTQRDYYIAMAMHFYGLLIAQQAPPDLASFTANYRERARLFAPQFIHWFVPNGLSLPFGRSLTYRFAQGAFWSALAWANEEALPWGIIKGILLRHLRSWLKEPIFDSAGILSIGYNYPNLHLAESYNSPASPYWAMKALIIAGLVEDHPFWQATEEPLPLLPAETAQKHSRLVIRRHDDQQNITALTSGQFPNGWHLRNAPAKYAKFAYSTRFGFSLSLGSMTLEDGAYDNMLALSDEGKYWRVRDECHEVRIEDSVISSEWSVWPDVHVRTWLFFDADWQVRIHWLNSRRHLQSAEAGHAIPWVDMTPEQEQACMEMGQNKAAVVLPENAAGLIDPRGSRVGTIIFPTPNSNVLYPRSILPTLRGDHLPGIHWLVTFLPITYNPATFSQLLNPTVGVDAQSTHVALALPSGRRLSFTAS